MSDSRRRPTDYCAEILALFARGTELTRRLAAENQALGQASAETASPEGADLKAWEQLRSELLACLDGLRSAETALIERFTGAREESQLFAQRCAEVEMENDRLAALYVAGHQLHSTLDLGQVLKIITEITLNLIGAERMAVFVVNEQARQLEAVTAEGLAVETLPHMTLGDAAAGDEPLLRALQSRETVCRDPDPAADPSMPLVAIPMQVQNRAIGVIAIYSLLQHKDGISVLDRELFTLLAGHAATAIFAARLYSDSKRKLNTIQGFIDLLTK